MKPTYAEMTEAARTARLHFWAGETLVALFTCGLLALIAWTVQFLKEAKP